LLALHSRTWLAFVGRTLVILGVSNLVRHPPGDVIEPVIGRLRRIAEVALASHGPRMHVGSRVAAVVDGEGGGIPCCIRKSGKGAAQPAMWW
jgi:hypothetical protein